MPREHRMPEKVTVGYIGQSDEEVWDNHFKGKIQKIKYRLYSNWILDPERLVKEADEWPTPGMAMNVHALWYRKAYQALECELLSKALPTGGWLLARLLVTKRAPYTQDPHTIRFFLCMKAANSQRALLEVQFHCIDYNKLWREKKVKAEKDMKPWED